MQNWEWTTGLLSTKTFVFVLFKRTDGGITHCFTPHYTSCVMSFNICMKVHKGIFKSFHPLHMCFISAKQKYLWLIQWTELFHHYIIGINYSTKFQKLTANAARRSFPKISVEIMSICSAPSPHSPLQYKFHSLQPFVTVKIKGDSYNFHKVNICSCQLHLLCRLVPKEISSHSQSVKLQYMCDANPGKINFPFS